MTDTAQLNHGKGIERFCGGRDVLASAAFIVTSLCRRMKLEKELVAQLWRICWDDIQMSNLDKVLRSGSRITLSLVSVHTHTHTHTHTHSDPVCVCREALTTAPCWPEMETFRFLQRLDTTRSVCLSSLCWWWVRLNVQHRRSNYTHFHVNDCLLSTLTQL